MGGVAFGVVGLRICIPRAGEPFGVADVNLIEGEEVLVDRAGLECEGGVLTLDGVVVDVEASLGALVLLGVLGSADIDDAVVDEKGECRDAVRTRDRLVETMEGVALGRGTAPLVDMARVPPFGTGDVTNDVDAGPDDLGKSCPGGADVRLPDTELDDKAGMLDVDTRLTPGDFNAPLTDGPPVDFMGDLLDVVDILLLMAGRKLNGVIVFYVVSSVIISHRT